MKRWQLAIVGLVIVGGLGVGVALGAIPDAAGRIHACYARSGDLRVINTGTGARCKRGETPLMWARSGPAGPAGPAGSAGPAGPAGPGGAVGPAGPAGGTHLIIRTSTQTSTPNSSRTFTAFCEKGEGATGGGWRMVGPVPSGSPPITVLGSVPQSSSPEPSAGEVPIGWKVIGVANHDSVAHDVTAFVVCASP